MLSVLQAVLNQVLCWEFISVQVWKFCNNWIHSINGTLFSPSCGEVSRSECLVLIWRADEGVGLGLWCVYRMVNTPHTLTVTNTNTVINAHSGTYINVACFGIIWINAGYAVITFFPSLFFPNIPPSASLPLSSSLSTLIYLDSVNNSLLD